MLDNALKSQFISAHALAITMLGTPVDFKDTAGVTTRLTAGIKTGGTDDSELVNAYGVGTKILTIRKADLLATPKKFDQVHVVGTGERLTVSSVVDVHLNGDLIAYKLIIAGK